MLAPLRAILMRNISCQVPGESMLKPSEQLEAALAVQTSSIACIVTALV